MDPAASPRREGDSAPAPLGPRVLDLLMSGKSVAAIADARNMTRLRVEKILRAVPRETSHVWLFSATMSRDVPPGAADRAVALITCLVQGRWEEVVGEFDDRMRERVDAGRLASGWAHTVGMVGRFERMGEPLARRAVRSSA